MTQLLPHRTPTTVLRRREVEARVGVSRSTLYEWMKQGEFPLPIKLGKRAVAWRESDINGWLDSRKTRAA
ncbi:helix-turn-helix transcriptional regulator [Meridianimarinicoccus aquatilis]|uniref:helix-turn-helix transcriptional regulator n=1 Tax=Meridianimarinicoccus aquatilis TaxID=2552766 RepID=UPI001FB7A779|nr:AlpA family transcriptional regulator [Fluviibacterium aquatile]